MAALYEDYLAGHVAKVKGENDPTAESVRAVLPLWDRLAQPPLCPLAARRMTELMEEAMPTSCLRFRSERVDDLWLITSVVPAFENEDVIPFFEPEGYAEFTLRRGGGVEAAQQGRWIAHWTLCIGPRSPKVHLTVLPSFPMLESGPALMLWAQDLFTPQAWRKLQETFS